jgi:hypothetical protein
MADSQLAKCAHPACECKVPKNGPFGKFCSEYCRERNQMTELKCRCDHDECK